MEQDELRLQNIISYRDETECVVSSLGVNGFETLKNDYMAQVYGSDDIRDYEPIPLTEEWLTIAGYTIIHQNDAGIIFNIVVLEEFLDDDFQLVYFLKGENKGRFFRKHKEIKYVHELQNLYFTLTGFELINL